MEFLAQDVLIEISKVTSFMNSWQYYQELLNFKWPSLQISKPKR
jgi:hypothetical protein